MFMLLVKMADTESIILDPDPRPKNYGSGADLNPDQEHCIWQIFYLEDGAPQRFTSKFLKTFKYVWN